MTLPATKRLLAIAIALALLGNSLIGAFAGGPVAASTTQMSAAGHHHECCSHAGPAACLAMCQAATCGTVAAQAVERRDLSSDTSCSREVRAVAISIPDNNQPLPDPPPPRA